MSSSIEKLSVLFEELVSVFRNFSFSSLIETAQLSINYETTWIKVSNPAKKF